MTRDYIINRSHWNGVEIEIRWNPDYIVYEDKTRMAHLEVESISPKRAPLPITETGYRSRFTPVSAVQIYVTPEDFVEVWLDQASRSAEWRAFDLANRQLLLL